MGTDRSERHPLFRSKALNRLGLTALLSIAGAGVAVYEGWSAANQATAAGQTARVTQSDPASGTISGDEFDSSAYYRDAEVLGGAAGILSVVWGVGVAGVAFAIRRDENLLPGPTQVDSEDA